MPTPATPSVLTRLHSRLQQWVDRGWSDRVVLLWGLLQGFAFPGVADLFFLPLALARPQRAYRLALVATAGTVIGSVSLYWLGAEALEWLQGPVSRVVGLTATELNAYRARLAEWGGLAIFASTMSPLSTKLTSIASGAAGVPFAVFTAALLAGRLTRTMALAWLVRHGGAELVARWVGETADTVRSGVGAAGAGATEAGATGAGATGAGATGAGATGAGTAEE